MKCLMQQRTLPLEVSINYVHIIIVILIPVQLLAICYSFQLTAAPLIVAVNQPVILSVTKVAISYSLV